jgi:hypothetical protein
MAFLTKLWNGVRAVLGLILPVFSKARDFPGLGRGLRWAIHLLLLALVLVGLYWLNGFAEVKTLLGAAPTVGRIRLHDYYLPLLFLAVYLLAWLARWLRRLLMEEETSDYPDIDEAWDEAVDALGQAGIALSEAPLFLILGQPAGGEEALFGASQLPLLVKQVPRRPAAPLHVSANAEGIYVTCAGASLLGRQAAILAGHVQVSADGQGGVPGPEIGGDEDPFKTMRPRGKLLEVQAILARAREQGRTPEQLTDQERQEIRGLLGQEEAEAAQRQGRPRPMLLKNAAEVELLSARLGHLCRLIARDRRPYCPINGILLLVPFAGGESEEDANQLGALCQQDLSVARKVLRVNCPVFALVCDLEKAPGFADFLARFPEAQRQRRLGQRFPLAPDVEPAALPGLTESLVRWVCNNLFPAWATKLFRVEASTAEELAAVVRGNAALFQLVQHMHERQKHYGRLVVRALAADDSAPWLFGGCYVCSTGGNAREQAFVAGVFRRLIENQNFVSWTAEALAEDEAHRRWTKYGYVGVGLTAMALLLLVWSLWRPR